MLHLLNLPPLLSLEPICVVARNGQVLCEGGRLSSLRASHADSAPVLPLQSTCRGSRWPESWRRQPVILAYVLVMLTLHLLCPCSPPVVARDGQIPGEAGPRHAS